MSAKRLFYQPESPVAGEKVFSAPATGLECMPDKYPGTLAILF
jgi:hypothetical protein